jgi:isopenicillin-N N-acyltransferase-like protein
MPDQDVFGMPVLRLSGTPFERGYAHGVRFRQEIKMAIADMETAHEKARCETARRKAEAAWPLVRELSPLVASEIEGIAEGSGTAVPDIMLRSGFEFFDPSMTTGCSAVALSRPSGAIVAQNWDALPPAAQELVLFLHFGEDGFEQAVVASYGGLCWVGCNRHGLALVNNDLVLSSSAQGLPSQIVRRVILEEPSVSGAVDRLKALPHMSGRSYLLGDSSGAVAGVEVSASVGVRVNQVKSPILHTNHALHPDIAADEDKTLLKKTHPSSGHRYDVLRRKCPREASVEAIALLLADMEGHPDSVSKAASAEEPTATVFSAIFGCGERRLLLCPGAPGDHPHRQFTL